MPILEHTGHEHFVLAQTHYLKPLERPGYTFFPTIQLLWEMSVGSFKEELKESTLKKMHSKGFSQTDLDFI